MALHLIYELRACCSKLVKWKLSNILLKLPVVFVDRLNGFRGLYPFLLPMFEHMPFERLFWHHGAADWAGFLLRFAFLAAGRFLSGCLAIRCEFLVSEATKKPGIIFFTERVEISVFQTRTIHLLFFVKKIKLNFFPYAVATNIPVTVFRIRFWILPSRKPWFLVTS